MIFKREFSMDYKFTEKETLRSSDRKYSWREF